MLPESGWIVPFDRNPPMNLIDRKCAKLLAQSQGILADMTGEALCEHPQKAIVRQMLAELKEMLAEFEDAYFESQA
jgi:hypothetical protein